MSQALICLANCDSFMCVRCVSSDILASSALTSHQLRLIFICLSYLLKMNREWEADGSGFGDVKSRLHLAESRVESQECLSLSLWTVRVALFVVLWFLNFNLQLRLSSLLVDLFVIFLFIYFFLTFCCAFASSHQLNNINSTSRWKSQRELISYPRVVIKYANAIKHS